jgi:hypothetical protein
VDKVDGVGLKILQAQQASRYRNATVHMPCTRHAHATCTCRATHTHMTLQAQDLTLPSFTDRVHIFRAHRPARRRQERAHLDETQIAPRLPLPPAARRLGSHHQQRDHRGRGRAVQRCRVEPSRRHLPTGPASACLPQFRVCGAWLGRGTPHPA